MRKRSLRFPDLNAFHDADDYSSAVCSTLITAYTALHDDPHDISAYARAIDIVRPTLAMSMAKRQRVRVCYVLGMANAAVGEYQESKRWLGQAVYLASSLAKDVTDPIGMSDLLDLLYLRGAVHRGVARYAAMADDYREFLRQIEILGQSPDALEAPFTLEVQIQLSGAQFFLARYDEAGRSLDRARDMFTHITHLGLTSETRLIEGTLEWFQALIDRWRGAPALALNSASRAAHVYRELGAPISAARAQLVVADIRLDLAMREPTEQARRRQVDFAQPLITEGMRLIAESGDPVGRALAQLTETRWSRLAGRSDDRIRSIEGVITLGNELKDVAILTQAYTSLGDELRHQGHAEAGFQRYYQAQSQAKETESPALGVWAQRALLRRSEDNV